MPRSPEAYLGDIVSACTRIQRYTDCMTFEDYMASDITRAAVERMFSIIGEALKMFLMAHPELRHEIRQVSDVLAFRNRVIHGYFSVQDELVWSVVKVNVPELKEDIGKVLGLHYGR